MPERRGASQTEPHLQQPWKPRKKSLLQRKNTETLENSRRIFQGFSGVGLSAARGTRPKGENKQFGSGFKAW